ncbi:MAG: 50S ribosomal protein L6 [Ignavibacteria bacterium]|jgi:large subunit ribosomal protein L6|nr:50S ribosomal protein L6 [Ignavibacteria bacterium]
MSRIGKKPIEIPGNVKLDIKDKFVSVTGPKGTLSVTITGGISVNVNGNEVTFARENDNKKNKALHGLYRALLMNMINGVTDGYSRKLELVGIGYKAEMKGKLLFIQLGYSHPILFKAPDEINIEVPVPTNIVISGIDKQLVGLVASKIRSFRSPEPYKGKGIKYDNEVIRRKAGKTAAK